MKTSVIEVHDMLSVFSVDEVEKRIGKVPGVESVTVNFAAGGATVRQNGYESAAPDVPSAGNGHEAHTTPGAPPVPSPAAPKTPPAAPAAAGAASAGTAPAPAAPKSEPGGAPAPPAKDAPAGHEQHDKDKT